MHLNAESLNKEQDIVTGCAPICRLVLVKYVWVGFDGMRWKEQNRCNALTKITSRDPSAMIWWQLNFVLDF